MRGLDEHITGPRGKRWEGDATCENGHVWEVMLFSEYGTVYFADDADQWCPVCKRAGEVI